MTGRRAREPFWRLGEVAQSRLRDTLWAPSLFRKPSASWTGSRVAVPPSGPPPGGQCRSGAAGSPKYHVPGCPWPCLHPKLLPDVWQVLGFKTSVVMVWPVSPRIPGARHVHWVQPSQPLTQVIASDAGEGMRNYAASERGRQKRRWHPRESRLNTCHRDETRTAYILHAVESAWEGVDRRKATDAKDPPAAEDPNGVIAPAGPVGGPSSRLENSEEEEVCVWSAVFPCFPCPFPETSPFLVSALREKGFFWN